MAFEYTNQELTEIIKCKKDIIYFAEKYCKVKTKEGIKQIVLRDYQIEVLNNYTKYKKNIFLAARQIGKCCSFDTNIVVKEKDIIKVVQIGSYYYEQLEKERKLNIFEKLKKHFFELFTMFKNTSY